MTQEMTDPGAPRFSRRIAGGCVRNPLASALAARKAAGLPVLDMAESNPTRVGLGPSREVVLASLADPESLRYEPDPRGLRPAREAIVRSMGGGADPDSIFLCASSSEAYGWLFKLLCDPGDMVLVPKPGYPLFDYLAALESVVAEPYRLEYAHPAGWRIDFESVRSALRGGRVRAMVLIHPNNPTGSYILDRERAELVSICAQAGVALVVDEVFRSYGVEDKPSAGFSGEVGVLTFVLDGFSKLLALPQMKLGWMAVSGPPDSAAPAVERLEIIADTYLSAGSPVMNAAPALLAETRNVNDAICARTKANMREARLAFEGRDSPYRVLRCAGGWSVVLEIPRVMPDEDIALSLLGNDGIHVHPGYLYDFEREGFLVMSLILPERDFQAGVRAVRVRLDSIIS
ncbi:MAG: pyridoxal phosphate-dependent aminotransferase [Spirochaetes bacterium]|nr:pyridoxal phosphate-dependent aminotransferase [Spirochaetota bacterium]